MTIDEFVKVVKLRTSDAAVNGTLKSMEHPAGRSPSEKKLKLSRWYNQLTESDRIMLRAALREAAKSAVFGFFCILDGVRVIEEPPEKGDLELYYVKGQERKLLNNPNGGELHDLFNGLCEEEAAVEFGKTPGS